MEKIRSAECLDTIFRVGEIPIAEGLIPSRKNPSSGAVSSEENLISGASIWEGPAMVRSKEYYFIQYWNEVHGIGIQETIGRGVLPCLLRTWNQSVVLYWVIRCCGWIGGEVLSYPVSEPASRVRMYTLRRPY